MIFDIIYNMLYDMVHHKGEDGYELNEIPNSFPSILLFQFLVLKLGTKIPGVP